MKVFATRLPCIFALLLGSCLVGGALGRLFFVALAHPELSAMGWLRGLAEGFGFDFALCLYLALPFAAAALLPPVVWNSKICLRILRSIFAIEFLILLLAPVCEIFFITEFHARYNFIAVDYLVYTSEVLRNIWESYPLAWLLAPFGAGIFALGLYLFRWPRRAQGGSFGRRAMGSALLVSAAVGAGLFFSEGKIFKESDLASSELAKNSIHTLFSAYHNNEIDYRRFYRTMDRQEAEGLVLAARTPAGSDMASPFGGRKPNVVLVLMESMSARFLRSYGAPGTLTNNLDRLAHKGLFFSRVYSTGTRTVRGIEAVMLSVPPTPGQSIVRRPGGAGLASLGSVFRSAGYNNQFLYGGDAYFDNMKDFFEGNDFSVHDQAEMSRGKVAFRNAWGVSDEDIFRYAVQKADESSRAHKPFFQFILTVSNHRPYTFPEGRINMPSHSGREAAVKYADYAIGAFLAEAAKKDWYSDTLFIFVADHNASVAGGIEILPADYRIPLIFYAPGTLRAQTVNSLGSQIDLAPTLCGLVGLPCPSSFFGQNLLGAAVKERAYLGTYEKVGSLFPNQMVVLAPNREVETAKFDGEMLSAKTFYGDGASVSSGKEAVRDTIAAYQTASDWYAEGRLKEKL